MLREQIRRAEERGDAAESHRIYLLLNANSIAMVRLMQEIVAPAELPPPLPVPVVAA